MLLPYDAPRRGRLAQAPFSRPASGTRDLLDYARRGRLPHIWRDTARAADSEAAALVSELEPNELPLVRLPGATELRNPSHGQLWRALGIGSELGAREEVDLAVIGTAPPGSARRSTPPRRG
jgi:plasmid stabilization system protein ParE